MTAAAVSAAGSDGDKRTGIRDPELIRPAAVHKLVNYDSCADLLSGLRQHAAAYAAEFGYGMTYAADSADGSAKLPAAAAPGGAGSAAPQHSDTTVHEPGADEPDLVKTDGRRVVTVVNGTLRVVDTASRRVTGSVRITPARPEYAQPANLLLSGDRALVIMPVSYGIVMKPAQPSSAAVPFPQPSTRFVLVDLAGTPKVLGSQTVTGDYLDGRLVGSVARLVARSQPAIRYPGPVRPGPLRPGSGPSSTQDQARAAALATPLSAWLPGYSITANGQTTNHTVDCRQVSHPDDYTGLSMLTVYSVDLSRSLGGIAPISLAADGDTVYGTTQSLYVASNPRWYAVPLAAPGIGVLPQPGGPPGAANQAAPTTAQPGPAASTKPLPPIRPIPPRKPVSPTQPVPSTPAAPQPPPQQTEIHRFDITGGGAPRYLGSGTVPGRLINQYALSEYAGFLRVATTSEQLPAQQQSAVYVLKADTMMRVGSVTGLGKGQRIYSVRFIGPVGYVVTFRQIDPLYTLDLSVPAHPRVAGELELTGYSAYLAPAGDGRLIGIGQEADSQGETAGLQVALFDVRDPAHPKRLAQLVKNGLHSEAESDPHAFLYWPATGTVVLPVNSWTGGEYRASVLVLHVSDSAITQQGTVGQPHNDQPIGINRAMIIGSDLWTMSPAGLQVSNAGTLADRGWIALG